METIADLMYKDHENVENLFKEFQEKKSKESLERFKWTLEKHFFIEEKAIFTVVDVEDFNELINIKKEHDEILLMLSDLDENSDISEFEKMLVTHKNYEDEVLYPKFDKELSNDIKCQIIERISEVVR